MKLSVWAKQSGVSYQTAWNWFTAGQLPVPAIQTATGTILVQLATSTLARTAIYARVSGSDQKADLDRQVARLSAFAATQGLTVCAVICETGSGLNGKRPKLLKLLQDRTISTVLVEHRERLARFGFEYLEAALSAQGRNILVAEQKELSDDLVTDMVEVLTSFCARLYGRRSAKHKAQVALAAVTTALTTA